MVVVRRERQVSSSSRQQQSAPASQPSVAPPSTSPASSSPQTPGSASSTVEATSRKRGRGPALALRVRQLRGEEGLPVELQRGNAVGNNGQSFTTFCGVLNRVHCTLWQQDFSKLPAGTKEAIFRDLTQHFSFARSPTDDEGILRHMGAQQKNKRHQLKKKYFNGKSFEEAVTSVPPKIDPTQWQRMCEIWMEESSKGIAQRNMVNRAHLRMTYMKGRISHRQLNYEFQKTHGRNATRPEIFHLSHSKEQPDGTIVWSSEQSQQMMDHMTLLMHPVEQSGSDTPPTTLTPEEAFVEVMGRDRPGRIRCGGRGETRRTWYPSEDVGSSSSSYRTILEHQTQQQSQIVALQAEIAQYREREQQTRAELRTEIREELRTEIREELRAGMQVDLQAEVARQLAQFLTRQHPHQHHQQSDDLDRQEDEEDNVETDWGLD